MSVTDRYLAVGEDPFEAGARTVGEIAGLIISVRPLADPAVSALFVEAMGHRIALNMQETVAKFGEMQYGLGGRPSQIQPGQI